MLTRSEQGPRQRQHARPGQFADENHGGEDDADAAVLRRRRWRRRRRTRRTVLIDQSVGLHV